MKIHEAKSRDYPNIVLLLYSIRPLKNRWVELELELELWWKWKSSTTLDLERNIGLFVTIIDGGGGQF